MVREVHQRISCIKITGWRWGEREREAWEAHLNQKKGIGVVTKCQRACESRDEARIGGKSRISRLRQTCGRETWKQREHEKERMHRQEDC